MVNYHAINLPMNEGGSLSVGSITPGLRVTIPISSGCRVTHNSGHFVFLDINMLYI